MRGRFTERISYNIARHCKQIESSRPYRLQCLKFLARAGERTSSAGAQASPLTQRGQADRTCDALPSQPGPRAVARSMLDARLDPACGQVSHPLGTHAAGCAGNAAWLRLRTSDGPRPPAMRSRGWRRMRPDRAVRVPSWEAARHRSGTTLRALFKRVAVPAASS